MLSMELIQTWTFMRISGMIIIRNVETSTVYALKSYSIALSCFVRSGSTFTTDFCLITSIRKMIKSPAFVALNYIR